MRKEKLKGEKKIKYIQIYIYEEEDFMQLLTSHSQYLKLYCSSSSCFLCFLPTLKVVRIFYLMVLPNYLLWKYLCHQIAVTSINFLTGYQNISRHARETPGYIFFIYSFLLHYVAMTRFSLDNQNQSSHLWWFLNVCKFFF